ncbi:MAG TPA: stage V sporulation protein AC [Firmicutes bacterium]|nr:stage V sporulation protein AC [Bacillales bacterium]HJA40560.1 stage V sporulation protein AC [Bacillota bacterium]
MKKETESREKYKQKIQSFQVKRPVIQNCFRAFWVGGTICLIGQGIENFYMKFFDFTKDTVAGPTVATLVLISVLLTGFGVYDKIAQYAGAGSAVPVTGFANSMASAAIEHRSEGLVLGIGMNMFQLAGSVIVFGVASAYVLGLIRYAFSYFM